MGSTQLTDMAIEMDSTFVAVALLGIAFLAWVADAPSLYVDVMDGINDLIAEGASVADYLLITVFVLGAASLLASPLLFLFSRSPLPVAAASAKLVLASLSAGATRRVNLARELVISATLGFHNAPGLTALAGILFWMFCRLFLSLLLLAFRPFLPGIRRDYNLWKNCLADKAGDFVDFVCIDMGKRIERRRFLESLERAYCTLAAKLTKLNGEVAQVAYNAEQVWASFGYLLASEYAHLRPIPFARVAVAAPEEGPVANLGLWHRLSHWIDCEVFWTDQKIQRIKAAMDIIQVCIADLDHQLKVRRQQIGAIEHQVPISRQLFSESVAREHRAAQLLRVPYTVRQIEPRIRTMDCTAQSARHRTTTSVSKAVVLQAPSADVGKSPSSLEVKQLLPALPATEVAAIPGPDSTLTPPPLLLLTAPPPSPPATPAADQTLALAAATPLPKTAEETAVSKAYASVELNRA
jgi:hypothetical protein